MSATKEQPWLGTWPTFLDDATETPACRGEDTNKFFPALGGNARPAKAICDLCPLVDVCREWALSQPAAYVWGVWGGLSESERRTWRRRNRTAEVAA